jgi:hypothetical protein
MPGWSSSLYPGIFIIVTSLKETFIMKPWKRLYPNIIPVEVPDGVSGPWSISSYEVSKEAADFGAIRAAFSSERGRYVPAGTYKSLKRNDYMIMSNTPDEIRDCSYFFHKAYGKILINGLGLGIALDVILNKLNDDDSYAVTEVIVIELSQDVINLVAPTFKKDPRVNIINADAYEYKPIGRFNAVWHDIWDDITADNLPGMHKLHRKYGKKTDWQGSWCRERCELLKQTSYRRY